MENYEIYLRFVRFILNFLERGKCLMLFQWDTKNMMIFIMYI